MSFDVDVESENHLVRITLRGTVNVELIAAAIMAYLSRDGFLPDMGRLYVFDAHAELSELNAPALRDLAALTARSLAGDDIEEPDIRYPVAVTCSTSDAETLMRLYKAIFDAGDWEDVDLEVFASEDKARAWLAQMLGT